MSDDLNRRRGSVPYAYPPPPPSHKGYSAYSRETYKGAELDYRGRQPAPPQAADKPDTGNYNE